MNHLKECRRLLRENESIQRRYGPSEDMEKNKVELLELLKRIKEVRGISRRA